MTKPEVDLPFGAFDETGYEVLIDGEETVVGSTSAVAPLWAALIARIIIINGAPAGFVNAKLYKAKTACTGLGSPNGAKVLAALGGGAKRS